MNDLAIRFTRVSMQAGITLAHQDNRALFEVSQEFRGLKEEAYQAWCKRVFEAVGKPVLAQITKATVSSFRKRLKRDPQSDKKLSAMCEKIERHLSPYKARRSSLPTVGQSSILDVENKLRREWRTSSM